MLPQPSEPIITNICFDDGANGPGRCIKACSAVDWEPIATIKVEDSARCCKNV